MNILRRIFGGRQESPTPEPEVVEAEEMTAPDHMHIPGVAVEVPNVPTPQTEEAVPFGATRQLPPLESALSRPNQHIKYGQSTDVGMVRSNNQDAVFSFFVSQGNAEKVADFGLYIVADGMGGHHDGEKASAIATQVLAEQITRKIYLPILKSSNSGAEQLPPVAEALSEAVKASNDLVVKYVPEGGTTVTAATIIGDLVYIAHVGDSRAYLVTEEYGMEQITRDHSLVQRLIELDQLTPEEAAQHPQKNVLYRAIGQSDNLEVDAVTRRLPSNCFLLLCSDGLWNMVPEDEILHIILHTETPQNASDRLVAAANEHGGMDNISAIVLQIPA